MYSASTVDVILRHQSDVDPQKRLFRLEEKAYKVKLDPDLKMCFSFFAFGSDFPRLEKEVLKFREEAKEREIYISDRLKTKSLTIMLSENGTIAAFKQLWELNPHLPLVFQEEKNHEVKLRFAKHYHQTEGIIYGDERLKKNRHLSEDILSVRAYHLHERLIQFEFQLRGKTLTLMRGSHGGIDLKDVMNWFQKDPLTEVYSFYPVEKFPAPKGEMIFQPALETLP